MAKKGLHPNWFQTKVYCDGKLIPFNKEGIQIEDLEIPAFDGLAFFTKKKIN